MWLYQPCSGPLPMKAVIANICVVFGVLVGLTTNLCSTFRTYLRRGLQFLLLIINSTMHVGYVVTGSKSFQPQQE